MNILLFLKIFLIIFAANSLMSCASSPANDVTGKIKYKVGDLVPFMVPAKVFYENDGYHYHHFKVGSVKRNGAYGEYNNYIEIYPMYVYKPLPKEDFTVYFYENEQREKEKLSSSQVFLEKEYDSYLAGEKRLFDNGLKLFAVVTEMPNQCNKVQKDMFTSECSTPYLDKFKFSHWDNSVLDKVKSYRETTLQSLEQRKSEVREEHLKKKIAYDKECSEYHEKMEFYSKEAQKLQSKMIEEIQNLTDSSKVLSLEKKLKKQAADLELKISQLGINPKFKNCSGNLYRSIVIEK